MKIINDNGLTTICISTYEEEVKAWDVKVAQLKKRDPKANRSALIRYALRKVDPRNVPRGWMER